MDIEKAESKATTLRRRRSRGNVKKAVDKADFEPAQDQDSASVPASQASPIDYHDLVVIYQCVASRRASFDILLWLVPTTSFGAHAFLFTTALDGGVAHSSRLISMGLSCLVSLLTVHLFARQLQAEDADRRWLDDFEQRHQIPEIDRSHGSVWSKYQSRLPDPAKQYSLLTRASAFTFWANGMMVIGFVAFTVLLFAAFPNTEKWLENCGGSKQGG